MTDADFALEEVPGFMASVVSAMGGRVVCSRVYSGGDRRVHVLRVDYSGAGETEGIRREGTVVAYDELSPCLADDKECEIALLSVGLGMGIDEKPEETWTIGYARHFQFGG